MKKTIAKIAAVTIAAMMAGTVCMPLTVYADQSAAVSEAKKDVTEMQDALAKVKKRITVPAGLTEFEYGTQLNYGKKSFTFSWHAKDGVKHEKDIYATITGNVITSYVNDYYDRDGYSRDPRLAELSEEQILAKAKEYVKQLNPDIYPKLKFGLRSLSLTSNYAEVTFQRYENGVKVTGNGGSVYLDKNTGELYNFEMGWWEDAVFASAGKAISQSDVQAAYSKDCALTPQYRFSYEWDEKTQKHKKTARIVYTPGTTESRDAFTGKETTMWEDMKNAKGSQYYYGGRGALYEETECAADAGAADEANPETGMFTPAELKKIEQDNNLIKTDAAFEMLKKDPFVALTDDYKLSGYSVDMVKDNKDKETFYMTLQYQYDETKKKDPKDVYKRINVKMNAETGETEYLNKWNYDSSKEMPKLDVSKANAAAESVARTYAKNIFAGYKANECNTAPADVWYDSAGKPHYETSRQFAFDRYVNGISVYGDNINVTVDSNGVVTNYSCSHTTDVTFPSADILTPEQAFEKLFRQKKSELIYDGWVTKDGEVHTYLLYNIGGWYLNARTGAVCGWSGEKLFSGTKLRDVKYTDISGIKQEKAILALQKYGVGITEDSKFEPAKVITEDEFRNLLTSALGGYAYAVEEDVGPEDISDEEYKAKLAAEEKDKAETTREEAAVMFTKIYDREGIAELQGIFRTPYSDVKSSDKNAGYIAIAYAKGFFPKTANGQFGGGKKITRAEAAQMVYDYLKLLSR